MGERIYIAIDLKSFYASVECMERGLDPLKTNLVVADASRTEKTICLAVSPSMKAYGIPGRARLFEVVQKVKEINAMRMNRVRGRSFDGESFDAGELDANPNLKLSYIAAPPRMAHYTEYSTRVYNVYMKYVAPEDIFVYSIDEVFMDVTNYLGARGMTAQEFAREMILDVLKTTGITATAGIGTNLYLCKIAMDIGAKHVQPDEHGVRIAELDEFSYRRQLWTHRPLTDFWRVGRGYEKKLEAHGLFTMGDIARCSLGKPSDYHNEDLLYKLFGINAELLIDHAWGWEPCTMEEIKHYKPQAKSISSGQVLHCAYTFEKARLVAQEMLDALALNLVDKGLVTDQIVLTVGYDIESLTNPSIRRLYHGEIVTDLYGRRVPKHAHGTANLGRTTASGTLIAGKVMELFDEIVNPDLLVRRLTLNANHLVSEKEAEAAPSEEGMQMNLFSDFGDGAKRKQEEDAQLAQEKKMQKALLDIKHKFGKNAVLKGMDLEEGATAISRNGQIGGHKA